MTEDVAQLVRQAESAANAGRWDLAEKLWADVRRRDPGNPRAAFSLGVHALHEHAREHEELLGDRDEPEHAALPGLRAQGVDERVEGVGGARGQQHDLPQAVLAPGGDREVDGVVVHERSLPREPDGTRRRHTECQSGAAAAAGKKPRKLVAISRSDAVGLLAHRGDRITFAA